TYFADVVNEIVKETNPSLGIGGNDLVNFSGAAGIFVLGNNLERLTLTHPTANTGGIGNLLANTMSGNAGANILNGMAGADLLRGLGGNDKLLGGIGADTLIGGAGNDRLTGGAGIDTLTGGPGNDVFVLNAPLAFANRDKVVGFTNAAGNNDVFWLDHT